jgi:hypothetical protein
VPKTVVVGMLDAEITSISRESPNITRNSFKKDLGVVFLEWESFFFGAVFFFTAVK